MDIIQIIHDKTRLLPQDNLALGVKAVITHIETAEKYLFRAKKENDENLFTDVIYRTNHAFEGILKEAYSILAEKDSSKKTPNEIEKYLTDNNVFKPRLMDLFKNYRTEWRNPSTHEYNLFFSEQEAFLAIVNVSAFVSILLDQIIEKVNYTAEKAKADSQVEFIRSSITNYDQMPLLQKLNFLFLSFSQDFIQSQKANKDVREIEVLGLITGFFSALDPKIKIEQEVQIGTEQRLRADMVFSLGNEKAIVEIKRGIWAAKNLRIAQDQLSLYLLKSGITNGILYFFPSDPNDEIKSENITENYGGQELSIVRIYPTTHKR